MNSNKSLAKGNWPRTVDLSKGKTFRIQIPPAPNKPLIFLEKVRGFSLGVEKVSSLSLLEKLAF